MYEHGYHNYADIDMIMSNHGIEYLAVIHKQQLLGLLFHRSKDVTDIASRSENIVIVTRGSDKVKYASAFTTITRV